jgi:hypothetical protein
MFYSCLFCQKLEKYDYKNIVVSKEIYLAIPYCYLGEMKNKSLEYFNYMWLFYFGYDKYFNHLRYPSFDLNDILNYNDRFQINNIWYLPDVLPMEFKAISNKDTLWIDEFLKHMKSNVDGFLYNNSVQVSIGNTPKNVLIFSPNRIQIPVSKFIQKGINAYPIFNPIYDFYILKCTINYIYQDSTNIFMPLISPKRKELRNNLFLVSHALQIPFNIACKNRWEHVYTYYSHCDRLHFINQEQAIRDYRFAKKYYCENNYLIRGFKDALKRVDSYSDRYYTWFYGINYDVIHKPGNYKYLMKVANCPNKKKVNVYAHQTVQENFILSILEFSIPSEQELIEYISKYR